MGEVESSFKTMIPIYQTTWHQVTEGCTKKSASLF